MCTLQLWHAGCYEADLIGQRWTANPERCTDRTIVVSSSISDGAVCYNGTTEGSMAVYICNDGYVLMEGNKDTRVCQSDGMWNGSIPQCNPGTNCSQLLSLQNDYMHQYLYCKVEVCLVCMHLPSKSKVYTLF